MKLHTQQLTQHLTQNVAPLYIVCGDDPLLTEETLAQIRATALNQGFSEHERIFIEPSTIDWGKIFYASIQSMSLFSQKRLLELDLTQVKFNAANSKILQEYAKKPPENTVLLIRNNKLDSQTEKSMWYKALDKIGITIPIWPITIEQLPNWIMQRAKKYNLNITKPATELLATLVEGNLLAASQELEKLYLLKTTKIIDQEIISAIVTDNTHYDIFTLVDSALAGNCHRTKQIMKNLEAEDTEPTLILWALSRELRNMADIAKQLSQGISLTMLFQQFRVFEKRKPCVQSFLKKHRQEDCWELLLFAAKIDRIIKGAETGNSWDALTKLALGMSGIKIS